MRKFLSVVVYLVVAILVIAGMIHAILNMFKSSDSSFGSGGRQQVAATNLLGTLASKMGLATSTVPFPGAIYPTVGYDKVFFSGTYTPTTNNAFARVIFECSIDNGVTYFPLPARSAGTAEVDVFSDSGTGQSATSGIPFIIPGDKTSTANTAVTTTIAEFENTACTHYRVSAGETTTGSSGTIFIQAGGKIGQ